MIRRCFVSMCLMVSGGLINAVVAAQSAPPSAADEVEGHAHFDAGRDAFAQGRFEEALAEFKRAYELTARPGLLFDIGTSADRLRHDREALEAFEGYLSQSPEIDNRAEIEARIAILRQSVNAAPAVVESETPKQPAATANASPSSTKPDQTPSAAAAPLAGPTNTQADTRKTSRDLGPWFVIGASAAVAIGGGVLLAIALTDRAKVEHAAKGTRLSSLQSAHDAVPTLSTVGFAMLGVGVAGAAVGCLWRLWPTHEDTSAQVTLHIAPLAARLEGRF